MQAPGDSGDRVLGGSIAQVASRKWFRWVRMGRRRGALAAGSAQEQGRGARDAKGRPNQERNLREASERMLVLSERMGLR